MPAASQQMQAFIVHARNAKRSTAAAKFRNGTRLKNTPCIIVEFSKFFNTELGTINNYLAKTHLNKNATPNTFSS